MALCHICDQTVPDPKALEHLRLMHPEQYGDGPETWPDGGLVVQDNTLTPDDFGAGGE